MPIDIGSVELEEEELRCTRFVAMVRSLMVEVASFVLLQSGGQRDRDR